MTRKQEEVIEQHVHRTSYIRRLKVERKVCPQCGQRFEGIRKQRYCSRQCSNKADYAKHAPQRRSARMEKHRKEKGQKAL